ncbi:HDOD domain-containing protein [Pelagicoccus sp. SDUM812003]|uniref:HDOD domain-containing protein n=1 Tax=Pelagicoccus sp. SDUM812003 TaxID=3041267 RepID=UPI00280F39F9|nr:HDOD domain-containing protein [Pelagicoccus sp. SDUM812003]MDQ8204557.1 HDOD domain-containing protein [Pelagicoccus sp. SDUM812003]
MNLRIKNLFVDPNGVPDLPHIYRVLEDAVENPESSFEDIARLVESDATLSSRLLKLANSSFYSYPVTVTTVPDALSVIGLQQFKNIALAVSVPSIFSGLASPLLDAREFWKNCIAVGICARIMALDLRQTNTERFLLAGLFHKIGRLLAIHAFPEDYQRVLDRAAKEQRQLSQIEQAVLGFDCNELGASAMRHWRLPSSVVELVRYHAKPVLARHEVKDVSLIHIANFIVQSLRLGSAGDRFVPEFSEAAWDYSGLNETRLYYIMEELLREYREVCGVFIDTEN